MGCLLTDCALKPIQFQTDFFSLKCLALKIPYLSISGFEADDVIGTLALRAQKKNIQTYMVTGDKDFLQLLKPNVFIYSLKNKGELEILNEAIDHKIVRGLSYTKEAKRHKFLLLSLAELRRENQRFSWLARSLNLV